ncbi:MAG TPA: carboxypeptidase regulatory-like domain-containing protein [Bacteroidales bacterium]|nr:carboxypeptidase regulatory-like domain-containing protein [Bacteroidales bacterium]
MRNVLYAMAMYLMVSTVFISCKKDSEDDPTQGTLKGMVTSTSNQGISNARIIVYDANTNAPVGGGAQTGSDGSFSISLDPGTYYLNLSKQGYNGVPAAGTTPVSVTIEIGEETISNYQMSASSVVNGGSIAGKVTSGGNVLAGVLVVASSGANGYSSVTDINGNYYIYNVPAGTYDVKGFLSKYNSPSLSVALTAGSESAGNNLAMTSGATGLISGAVSFLATNNGEVDVTLTNPLTKETIPGLVTKTQDGQYSISNIPDGVYIVRASFANDNYVVDPDWIIKNGEPKVTIAANTITQNFSVTGSIKLTSPTNDSASVKPVEITGATPIFTWQAYSSTSDYIIEVSDINGNIIWGGFTNNGGTITKNIIIPKNQLSIVFNSDNKASSTLKTNTIYRWRIYASKDDTSSPTGWKLISVSEEQRGLFMIK